MTDVSGRPSQIARLSTNAGN